jgi:hypothetical protein
MNTKGAKNSTSDDLQEIEKQLRQLTLLVSNARKREEQSRREQLSTAPKVGDRVRFRIFGVGYTTGTVTAITPQRIRIKPDRSTTTVLRAPHNVQLLLKDDGTRRSTTAANDAGISTRHVNRDDHQASVPTANY